MNRVVFVVGPTASGKTKVAIDIAKALNGEVISADSVQIYKYVDIGSAKPSESEMQGIPHHLISVVEPGSEFSVVDYQCLARQKIADLVARGKLPIVAGGTGFYIDSVLYDMEFTDANNDYAYREHLLRLEQADRGILHSMLLDIDALTAKRLHVNDLTRIVRALEVFKQTGKPMSSFARDFKKQPRYDAVFVGLNKERESLYKDIDRRVDQMIESGLLAETRKLSERGIDIKSINAIGYRELINHLEGKMELTEAIDEIKKNTRHYAKRQLTWFRRNKDICWFNFNSYDVYQSMLKEIIGSIINP